MALYGNCFNKHFPLSAFNFPLSTFYFKRVIGMQTEIRSEINNSIQPTGNKGIYRRFLKRPMDFVLSLIAIIVLAPVLLVIAILVKIKLGSPIIFKQKRPGLNEKIFTIYKFRTMTDERDENGELLPDGDRLTKFGRFLRSTSLDELP